jgi:hypothetical protein
MSGARPPSPANPAATIFPSGRDGDAVHLVAVRGEVGDHDRVALEGGIERAIALVAHDRELRIPGVSCGGARDDDVAVSLDREGERGVVSERRADRGRLGRPGAGHLDTPEGIYEQSPNRLRVVDVATGSTTLLSEGGWLEVIGFTPEGDRVLFGAHRPVVGQPGAWLDSIWSIGVDGSDARQIVVGTYSGVLRPA